AESVLLFPELRRADPALNPVVDKLEADHAHISDLLADVEAAARDLSAAENPVARQRLGQALETLSADLLAHLQYEEEQISPTLRTWASWPHWGDILRRPRVIPERRRRRAERRIVLACVPPARRTSRAAVPVGAPPARRVSRRRGPASRSQRSAREGGHENRRVRVCPCVGGAD